MRKWFRNLALGFGGVVISLLLYISFRPVPSEILQLPDEKLRMVSTEVTDFDRETQRVVNELKTVIKKLDSRFLPFNALGLAAPQLGYSKRVVALRDGYQDYRVMINPEILEKRKKFPLLEKCFSLSGWHFVERYLWLRVRYTDMENDIQEEIFTGLQAATLQQEIDHLDGVLISDI